MRRHAKASSAASIVGGGSGAPSLRFGLASLLALAAFLALAASLASVASALAAQTHVFTASFGSPGSGDGQFELADPSGVAVDQETGNLYVIPTKEQG